MALDAFPRSDFVDRYHDDPALFVTECIEHKADEGPTDYQLDTLRALVENHRVAVRGPHGLGKTTTEAWAICWFATTREAAGEDWKIPTTAGVARQLEKYLWPEVHKWAKRLRWDLIGMRPWRIGVDLLDLNLKLDHGIGFAATSSEPEKIEGAHADELLLIATEAKAVPTPVFDAFEGAFSGAGEDTKANAYALVQSTPGPPVGRFYEIHARRSGTEDWAAIHVTRQRVIDSGRMSQQWADQRRKQWGADSSVYLNRVEGEFAADDESSVIPLSWVEAAMDRWRAWDEAGRPDTPPLAALGVDVADTGTDRSVIAPRHGRIITELWHQPQNDPLELGRATIQRQRIAGKRRVVAVVDSIGVGSGTWRTISEAGERVVPFVAGAGVDLADETGEFGFVNKRAAAWWRLRGLLDPANGVGVMLPPDDLLTGDLCAPRWSITAGAKIQVETKDDIKKRIGRSTDDGDAVVQAFWIEPDVVPASVVTYEDRVHISEY